LTLRREDGRIVCEHVEVADRTFRRVRGLLGRKNLARGSGITLRPAWSIHTAFMRFPIDVVFLDQELVVLRIDPSLRAFRTASCRGAREVVELAAGECAQRGLAVGDRVAWASYAAALPTSEQPSVDRPIEVRPRALVASRDARFVKLARFFLDQQGIEPDSVTPEKLIAVLESDDDVDVVVLDAHDELADALTNANAARAVRPEIPMLVVAETRAAERAPLGVRVYDKWNETDELVAAVKRALEGESALDASAAERQ
jgi:uncharacterized membrane protein (UPF0127 family)/CheY-like chemotaxis protein